MNKAILITWSFLACFLSAYSQADTLDPMRDHNILAKSSEIVVFNKDTVNKQLFLDVDTYEDYIFQVEGIAPDVARGAECMDVIYEDFDGDELDEMITCYYDALNSNGFVLDYYELNTDNKRVECKRLIEFMHLMEGGNIIGQGQTRMATGNFDSDKQKEFLLAYIRNSKIRIEVYNINSEGSAELLYSVSEESAFEVENYSIACGDFNNDRYDEIVVLKNSKQHNDPEYAITIYGTGTSNGLTVLRTSQLEFGLASMTYHMFEIVACDMNNDDTDELILGLVAQRDWEDERGVLKDDYYRDYYSFMWGIDIASQDFNIQLNDPLEFGYWRGLIRHYRPYRMYEPLPVGIALVSGDLNMDGKEEILFADGMHLRLLEYEESTGNMIELPVHNSFKTPMANARRSLAIAHTNYDSTSAILRPKVFSYAFIKDPRDEVIRSTSLYLQGGLYLDEFLPVVDEESRELSGLEYLKGYDMQTHAIVDQVNSFALAFPDFDGGGIKLGTPKRIRKEITEPLIVLNAPPTHFDVFENTPFDICMEFDGSENAFFSQYEVAESSADFLQTKTERSIGFSTKVKIGGKDKTDGGTKFGGSLSYSLSKQWEEDTATTSLVTVSSAENRVAEHDDLILAQVTKLNFWEYPVFFDNKDAGNILVLDPVEKDFQYISSTNLLTDLSYEPRYVPEHEIGNVFSYPELGDEILDDSVIVYNGSVHPINTTPASMGDGKRIATVAIDYEKAFKTESQSMSSTEHEVNAKGKLAFISVSLSGNYSNANLRSHSTEIKSAWGLAVYLDAIAMNYASAGYDIEPIIYWRKDGALAIDYRTQTHSMSSEGTWWENNYGDYPDPTFIMPFFHHERKGMLGVEGYRMLTRDIRTSPDKPFPGDTVTIHLTLRNFSLASLDQMVKIRLFAGHPDFDGEPIIDLHGNSVIELDEMILPRGNKTISILWVVPEDIAPIARIFAQIDYDSQVQEVHENNNLAFTEIVFLGAAGNLGEAQDYETGIQEEFAWKNETGKNNFFKIYPNPSDFETTLSFSMQNYDKVTLEVYDATGRLIETLLHNKPVMGQQELKLNLTSYPSGLYLCRLRIEKRVYIEKLVVP